MPFSFDRGAAELALCYGFWDQPLLPVSGVQLAVRQLEYSSPAELRVLAGESVELGQTWQIDGIGLGVDDVLRWVPAGTAGCEAFVEEANAAELGVFSAIRGAEQRQRL